jgi:excinuclease UvrABC nuclease subunit
MIPIKINSKTYKKAPPLPGIYTFYDRYKKPIYIGKSKSLKSRLTSYFALNLEPKTKKMLQNALFLSWTPTTSDLEAILLEANLVKKHLQIQYSTKR